MNYLSMMMISFLLLSKAASAAEISLIETGEAPSKAIVNAQELTLPVVPLNDLDEEDRQEDTFQEMDNFITEENEKMKEIRLSNLDLEKSAIELKKKEIEQKIAQLSKQENGSLLTKASENASDRPDVRLLGVFFLDKVNNRQAILSINGVRINLKEEMNAYGVRVNAIKSRSVLIQYLDGSTQEMYL